MLAIPPNVPPPRRSFAHPSASPIPTTTSWTPSFTPRSGVLSSEDAHLLLDPLLSFLSMYTPVYHHLLLSRLPIPDSSGLFFLPYFPLLCEKSDQTADIRGGNHYGRSDSSRSRRPFMGFPPFFQAWRPFLMFIQLLFFWEGDIIAGQCISGFGSREMMKD